MLISLVSSAPEKEVSYVQDRQFPCKVARCVINLILEDCETISRVNMAAGG